MTDPGVDVVDAGLGSTDLLYFASGSLDLPGAMFTASHNPAQLQRHQALPGRRRPDRPGLRAGARSGRWPSRTLDGRPPGARARSSSATCSPEYAAYLHGLVDLAGIRPLKVVVDAGNGMGGHTVPAVLAACRWTVVPMYFELDGTFPNHEANPLDPANLRRPAGRGPSSTAPTSGWPSTATPTAASSWTSGASR